MPVGRSKAMERYVFPALIAVPVAMMSLSELWPYLGKRETISVLADGVLVLSDPLPLYLDKEGTIKVLGELRQGDGLEVHREIYGKDYLMFEVRFNGRRGYVQYYGGKIDWECRQTGDC